MIGLIEQLSGGVSTAFANVLNAVVRIFNDFAGLI